jgi:hypothetical protein
MRRKKQQIAPIWLTWEGDDFPRQIHSDSVVFYLSEHIYLDIDSAYRRSLAQAILREGIASSVGESHRLIDSGYETRAGYRYEDADEFHPVYCDNSDPELDYDATFIEVPYVD